MKIYCVYEITREKLIFFGFQGTREGKGFLFLPFIIKLQLWVDPDSKCYAFRRESYDDYLVTNERVTKMNSGSCKRVCVGQFN